MPEEDSIKRTEIPHTPPQSVSSYRVPSTKLLIAPEPGSVTLEKSAKTSPKNRKRKNGSRCVYFSDFSIVEEIDAIVSRGVTTSRTSLSSIVNQLLVAFAKELEENREAIESGETHSLTVKARVNL